MEKTEYIITFLQNGEVECTQQFENEEDAIAVYAEYGDDTDKSNLTLDSYITITSGSL